MKLIIYLASHDPSAQNNYKRLAEHHLGEYGDVTLRQLEVDNGVVRNARPRDGNIFDSIPLASRNEVTVEFLSHGTGSPWLSSMPKGDWDDSVGAINVYRDITPTALFNYFRANAYDTQNGTYKFSELILYACAGYKFAKELALLMPDINITCFKEYIIINQNDAKAYPYTVMKDANNRNQILPIDKDGNPILNQNEIATKHHPAPLRMLKGETENVKYDSPDATPSLATPSYSRLQRIPVASSDMKQQSAEEASSKQESGSPRIGRN
jgi:hypothetical protein